MKDEISFKEIEKQLNKADFKKFCKWMYGQTVPSPNSVFKWDFERFRGILKGKPTYFVD